MRILFLASFASLASLAAGCGPACNSQNLCAIDGSAEDSTQVCDGSSFVTCGDDNRGQTIFCGNQPRRAVCGSGGWGFEYAPAASK